MTTENSLTFADLDLPSHLLRAIADIGYETPSPIQEQCIPYILEGHDLLGIAQTGTGKTAAFALPMLTKINIEKRHPQVLVLTPTRELAIQVAESFNSYASKMKGFKVLPIYGGQDMGSQLKQLKKGVQVVVGTPGRVMDHLRRGSLDLNQLNAVVLDEADEMLRMGFIEDVEWIMEHTPSERQIALFSATMPAQIRKVAENYLVDPKEVKIASKTSTCENIKQEFWMVSQGQKLDALTRILDLIEYDGIIIFTRTRNATLELGEKLAARGFSAAALNGDMNQALREKTIASLKKGTLDIVIATDVAARGIDVERVSHVINFDMPYDVESYVHRIGRTGRAGRSGHAILFATPREKRLLQLVEKTTKQKITPYQPPSSDEVTQLRVSAFNERIADTLSSQPLEFFDNMIEEFIESHQEQFTANQVAAALAFMAQQDQPLQVSGAPVPGHTARDKRDSKGRDGGRRDGDVNMIKYRLEVGREHNATPRDIVGCIANEAGLESRYIGQIRLFDQFSTVDLPAGMPQDTLNHLKNVFIRNKKLEIKVDTGPGERPRKDGGKKFSGKPKGRGDRRGKPHRKGNDK